MQLVIFSKLLFEGIATMHAKVNMKKGLMSWLQEDHIQMVQKLKLKCDIFG